MTPDEALRRDARNALRRALVRAYAHGFAGKDALEHGCIAAERGRWRQALDAIKSRRLARAIEASAGLDLQDDYQLAKKLLERIVGEMNEGLDELLGLAEMMGSRTTAEGQHGDDDGHASDTRCSRGRGTIH